MIETKIGSGVERVLRKIISLRNRSMYRGNLFHSIKLLQMKQFGP